MIENKEEGDCQNSLRYTICKLTEPTLEEGKFKFLFYPIVKKQFQTEEGINYDCIFEDEEGNITYLNVHARIINVPSKGFVTYYYDERSSDFYERLYSNCVGEYESENR